MDDPSRLVSDVRLVEIDSPPLTLLLDVLESRIESYYTLEFGPADDFITKSEFLGLGQLADRILLRRSRYRNESSIRGEVRKEQSFSHGVRSQKLT